MEKSILFKQTYINIEKQFIELSKYIFIADEKIVNNNGQEVIEPTHQLLTFSPYMADLLVSCCVQIEAISKELYFRLNGPKKRGDSEIKFDNDCLRNINIRWKTDNKCVYVVAPFLNLKREENRVLKPLRKAYKGQGTYWAKAYQAVKHDRYYYLHMGNVKALIQALAALYLLNVYYSNEAWTIQYKDLDKQDFSMGSALFSLPKPNSDKLWEGNNPVNNESPFVISYKDNIYQKINDIREKELNDLNTYWKQQPELNESAFIDQYKKASIEKGARFMPICELAKYRLQKLLPSTLSFSDRKQILIKSEAWNCLINQRNDPIAPENITEANIQDVINKVATRWGFQIANQYQKLEWIPIVNNGLCRIYIP